ncbi:MAG: methylenetetrahydrofolate reductase [NAD(P)H] [Gemmatimonadota bacterium]|nr:methylenetetrahydrofolate reductase [NAD(P)H] [Gemmatimonadota bacterium]MDQ8170271.1 methylenetetrahydrofolate reductase [NAD(P)H] [Gemmatimonadota bacterium]MDQ8175506.1 methylenetetrahydrofolate reductase [NAD(P)H] [Gemmatimonadota bacterium]MDQ8178780.1 methylenetetrahydrofolate reductase [NAD(P)H] [Gemmatimonadota bacterium]
MSSLALPVPFLVSFEFFPPKTAEMEETLWRSITRLAPLNPRFVSVTYGAGGSTRERTHQTVHRLMTETPLVPAAHLTCVGATRAEVDAVADDYWAVGVRHIVALRGDVPNGDGSYTPTPGGYPYASDLVEGLKRRHDFEITVAAYPETHPEALSPQSDLDNLKRKIDAGATRAITQMFFDNWTYLRYLDRVRKAGITIPIVPGIMPITNFTQTRKFAQATGAAIPSPVARVFDGLDGDPETRKLIAATVAAEQCQQLAQAGVTEFHFYTLNRADLAYALCHILGLRPHPRTPAEGLRGEVTPR